MGVCGKTGEVSDLQDLLIFALKGLSFYQNELTVKKANSKEADDMAVKYLFSTITNANFSKDRMIEYILETIKLRDVLRAELEKNGWESNGELPEYAVWSFVNEDEALMKAASVGQLSIMDEDKRSLSSLLLYGIRGMAAYLHHALVLGYRDPGLFAFIHEAILAYGDEKKSVDELLGLVLKCGELGVTTMSLLDEANTTTYGIPEPSEVNIGVGHRPGILVSGHDLKDLKELLEQSEDGGVDIYTHGEMLPAHYYPELKKYSHLTGNYGGSWWKQTSEFDSFNGPVLLTTNCLVPPKDGYRNRVYTTGMVGFDGLNHISDREDGRGKDFSGIIEHAKGCQPPVEIEKGSITGGFNHRTLWSLRDTVLEAVTEGKISKFVVMAGCDGRHRSRQYYSNFAEALPKDAVILTAGCAKYRYNKLITDDIGGIPRVIDAGQCNDSFSLALFAVKLADHLGVDINDLPVEYNIAWYEQKAVLVLLALLHLGVKNIRLGPTLPAFVSPNVLKILVENFNIGPNTDVGKDIEEMMK